jgi:predicted HTH transcriptional regulator
MTEEEFAQIIAIGREQPSVEFKGPGLKTDKHLFAKVTRAVLGMANRRDGGLVIVGVEENQTGLVLTGLLPEQIATWAYDDLADGFASYADPSVEFDTEVVEHKGQSFLIIRVEEFAEVPVLCKRGYHKDRNIVLRDGACYIRPRRKPETIEVSTYADMRDLIELATDKSLRRFIARAQSAGISLSSQKEKSDVDFFDKQAEDFQ